MVAKRVTSQDVADAAGVSRTTVSLVLNDVKGIQISDETRRRVISTAEKLGYVPDAAAQALASRRSQIIGLVLARRPHHVITDAFLNQMLEGLFQSVHQHNMRLLIDIVEPEHQKEAYLRLVRAKHIDGIILAGPRLDDDALRELEKDGFPTVLIGQLPGTSFCSVDIDNRAASRKAVAHLINLNHKRIACITNAPPFYPAPSDRLQGYRDAIEAAGLSFDEQLVRYADYDLASGYSQMVGLLENGLSFTAAFVSSDVVALGAKAAICERGLRIPEDIALVGFDDVPFARFMDPPLTTIHIPAVKMARMACDVLIQLIRDSQKLQPNLIIDTELIIRQSCGATLG
jgi:LacI family transcriptional regulator